MQREQASQEKGRARERKRKAVEAQIAALRADLAADEVEWSLQTSGEVHGESRREQDAAAMVRLRSGESRNNRQNVSARGDA